MCGENNLSTPARNWGLEGVETEFLHRPGTIQMSPRKGSEPERAALAEAETELLQAINVIPWRESRGDKGLGAMSSPGPHLRFPRLSSVYLPGTSCGAAGGRSSPPRTASPAPASAPAPGVAECSGALPRTREQHFGRRPRAPFRCRRRRPSSPRRRPSDEAGGEGGRNGGNSGRRPDSLREGPRR